MKGKILVVKHTESEDAGSLGEYLKRMGWNIHTVELSKGEKLPNSFKDISACIMMGGPMNVYEEDKYPFLKDEYFFIKDILKKEIPFLGVCLGAQLLAKSCEAKIKKSPVKEIGWYNVNLTIDGKEDILFKGLSDKINVFQWHEDTFDLPKRGILLARSSPFINQVFKIGENTYGLQFHIEITPELIRDWLRSVKDINIKKRIIKETFKRYLLCKEQANIIFNNFLNIIEN
jgi:GMP synthase-like glutamine amidotransferase